MDSAQLVFQINVWGVYYNATNSMCLPPKAHVTLNCGNLVNEKR